VITEFFIHNKKVAPMIRIYHNPRCRKSREALDIIRKAGHEPEIIEYLKTPPSASELKTLLDRMNMKPEEIVRKGEDLYKSNFKGKNLNDAEWLKVLVNHPKLIERPIVVSGDRVILGRPPEKVREIL
jgi:arsenate reductase